MFIVLINVPNDESSVIISLAQMDGRYYRFVELVYDWWLTLDYKIFSVEFGPNKPFYSGSFTSRSEIICDMKLSSGEYIVQLVCCFYLPDQLILFIYLYVDALGP